MPIVFVGINSVETNKPVSVAELKRRILSETGLTPLSYKICQLKKLAPGQQPSQSANICAIIPSQSTRLNIGVLNALSGLSASGTKPAEATDRTGKAISSHLYSQKRDNSPPNTSVIRDPSPANNIVPEGELARELFTLCDAFRLRYIIAKETHETVTRILESIKCQLEMVTRGPRTDFEAGLIQTVRQSIVTSVSERKSALFVALEAEIAEEERMETQFEEMAKLYRQL